MTRNVLISMLFAVLVAGGATAQQTSYSKFLVPLMPSLVGGADGARWLTELTLANGGFDAVPLYCFEGQTCMTVPARSIERMDVRPGAALAPGLIYVPQQFERRISAALRSRNNTPGTDEADFVSEIPVVPETDFRSSTIELPAVPIETNYRYMLRVYDANANEGAQVRVRIYGMRDGRVVTDSIVDKILTLHTNRGSASPFPKPDEPSWAQFPGFADEPDVRNYDEVHIRIDAISTGLEMWAMATATSNRTQRFAVYTP